MAQFDHEDESSQPLKGQPESTGDNANTFTSEQRSSFIMEELLRHGRVSVENLVGLLQTSSVTVRRDLRRLEQEGLLRRDHGGAHIPDPLMFQPFINDSVFRAQVRAMASEKQRIGMAGAAMVEDGSTIGVAGGTTVAQMLRGLRSRKDLTVVTNAVNVAMELSQSKNLLVHLTGGYMSGDWFALVGPNALDGLSQVNLDTCFLGAGGAHPRKGVTDQHVEESGVNRMMVRQAKTKVLLVDHTKLSVAARYVVCPSVEIDVMITDTGASDEAVAPFLDMGVDVRRV